MKEPVDHIIRPRLPWRTDDAATALLTVHRSPKGMRAVLDTRPTCKRCGKHPRGEMQARNFKTYVPFCSFHCQEWFRLEETQRYINTHYRGTERQLLADADATAAEIAGDLEGLCR